MTYFNRLQIDLQVDENQTAGVTAEYTIDYETGHFNAAPEDCVEPFKEVIIESVTWDETGAELSDIDFNAHEDEITNAIMECGEYEEEDPTPMEPNLDTVPPLTPMQNSLEKIQTHG